MSHNYLVVDLSTGVTTAAETEAEIEDFKSDEDYVVINLETFEKPSYFDQDEEGWIEVPFPDTTTTGDDSAADAEGTAEEKPE